MRELCAQTEILHQQSIGSYSQNTATPNLRARDDKETRRGVFAMASSLGAGVPSGLARGALRSSSRAVNAATFQRNHVRDDFFFVALKDKKLSSHLGAGRRRASTSTRPVARTGARRRLVRSAVSMADTPSDGETAAAVVVAIVTTSSCPHCRRAKSVSATRLRGRTTRFTTLPLSLQQQSS